jgi:hypothetical protein
MLDTVHVIFDLYVLEFYSTTLSSSLVVAILTGILLHEEFFLLGYDVA